MPHPAAAAAPDPDDRTVRYEVRHAPKGGMAIKGSRFKGGQFIPWQFVQKATPQQRAMMVKAPHPVTGKPAPPVLGPRNKARKGFGASIQGPVDPARTGGNVATRGDQLRDAIRARWSVREAQKKNTGRGMGFVSPWTRSGVHSTVAEAMARNGSMGWFRKITSEIDRKLGLRSDAHEGIGSWAPEGEEPGAEPTMVTSYRGVTDWDTIRYSVACKAYAGNQYAGLAFQSDPEGPDHLWSFMVAAELSGIGDILSKHGIEFRTVELSRGGKNQVILFDQGGAMADKVHAAAQEFGVKPSLRAGRGEFLGAGSTSRTHARKLLRREMRRYERKYPDRPHWP